MLPVFPHVTLLGVGVHAVTMAETLAWVEAAIAARTLPHYHPRQICTANPEFLMMARSDPEFRAVLDAADLVLPDGVGLLWAARWRGAFLPERVAGSDFIYRLAERGAELGWRLYLLGAAEGVARQAGERLALLYPGVIIAGTFSGSPALADEVEIVERVRAARPDLLLVAYGAPAQDKWIARHRQNLRVPVSIGVGGAIDFVAGVVRRAPCWMQSLGLEWLYRLWCQPWRARRIWRAVVEFPLAILMSGGLKVL